MPFGSARHSAPPPISSVSALFHQILPTCSSTLKMSHHWLPTFFYFLFFSTISHLTVPIKALIQPCEQQGWPLTCETRLISLADQACKTWSEGRRSKSADATITDIPPFLFFSPAVACLWAPRTRASVCVEGIRACASCCLKESSSDGAWKPCSAAVLPAHRQLHCWALNTRSAFNPCLPVCLLVCLPAWLPVCLSVCLHSCLLACLTVCLPAHATLLSQSCSLFLFSSSSYSSPVSPLRVKSNVSESSFASVF